MTALGLIAYRTTGKDTLIPLLSSLEEYEKDRDYSLWWIVYTSPLDDAGYIGEFLKTPRERVAFADALKKRVHEKYNIPLEKEKEKDTLLVDGKLLRQLYIEEGARGREEDPLCWVKIALPENLEKDVVITDVRYPNELLYLQNFEYLTARLYRSDVPVPDKSIESERSLDDAFTRVLLVTSEEEYEKALELFPDYRGFVPRFMIRK